MRVQEVCDGLEILDLVVTEVNINAFTLRVASWRVCRSVVKLQLPFEIWTLPDCGPARGYV